jgi:hypothetical protein
MGSHESKLFSWVLALVLPAFAVYPALLYPIAEHAHDAGTIHVFRSVVFTSAVAGGSIYPRWTQAINAGLGGPLFSFYPPLVYFLMHCLHKGGIPFPQAWQIIIALSLVAASVGAFGLGLSLFKRADAGLACAAGFAYAPYLLRDLFERGAPEGLALSLLPWLLLSLVRLAEQPTGRRFACVSICWAAIVLLHSLAALLFVPVLAIFLTFLTFRCKGRSRLFPALALLAGLALASFYLLPFLAERQYIQLENLSKIQYAQPAANPLALSEVLSTLSILDTSLGNNRMNHGAGVLHALALLPGLLLAALLWHRRRRAEAALYGSLAIAGLFVVWMQTDSATRVWTLIPALNMLQFRWKLLGVTSLAGAVTLGQLVALCPQRLRTLCVGALVTACVGMQLFSLYPQLLPQYVTFPPRLDIAAAQTAALEANMPGLSAFNELLPRWRTIPFSAAEAAKVSTTAIANLPNDGHIISEVRRNSRLDVAVETPVAFSAALHVLYFPGWVGYLDGQRRSLTPVVGSGYASIEVPSGTHSVTLTYEGTTVQHIGDGISAVLLVLLLAMAIFWRSGGQSHQTIERHNYVGPHWCLAGAFILIVVFKAAWVDTRTSLFRWSSTCERVHGAAEHAEVGFDQVINLCAYGVQPRTVHPGDALEVTLYWQLTEPIYQECDTFVHLLGSSFNPDTGNPLWGQQDKQTPGEFAVTQWTSGKLYRDTYSFLVAPHTPPGEYQLEIGWWQPATGRRLTPTMTSDTGALSISHLDSLLVSGIQVR